MSITLLAIAAIAAIFALMFAGAWWVSDQLSELEGDSDIMARIALWLARGFGLAALGCFLGAMWLADLILPASMLFGGIGLFLWSWLPARRPPPGKEAHP